MSRDASVQFRPLRLGEGQSLCLKTLPHRVQQFHFLRGGETVELAS